MKPPTTVEIEPPPGPHVESYLFATIYHNGRRSFLWLHSGGPLGGGVGTRWQAPPQLLDNAEIHLTLRVCRCKERRS